MEPESIRDGNEVDSGVSFERLPRHAGNCGNKLSLESEKGEGEITKKLKYNAVKGRVVQGRIKGEKS